MNLQATPVFEKNWDAINELDDNGERKWRYIINEGSSRSSKTWSLNQLQYVTASTQRDKRITIWRKTKTDCRATVYRDFYNFLTNSECYLYDQLRHNKTESTYYADHTNSSIEFNGTDDHQKVHGLTQSIAWFNEVNEITKDVFDQIDQRTSDCIFIDWNPSMNHWVDDLKKHPRALVIHSTYKENPFCPLESKLKIDGYEPTEQNIKNGTADKYMWEVYGLGLKAEKPNKIYHNWTKVSYAEFLAIDSPSYYGLDWGVVHAMGIVEVKYYDGTFYVHELSYKSENDLVMELNQLYGQDYQSELQKLDLGVITWHLQRLGLDKKTVIVCDSAKPNNIIELRRAEYNAIPAHKPAGSVYSGISMIKRANVAYTDVSYNLDNEYSLYEWNTDRYGLVTEEPIKANDDLLDPTRYVCTYLVIKLQLKI